MSDGKKWCHYVMLESGDTAKIELAASRGYRIDKPRLSFDLDAKELVLRFRVEQVSSEKGVN